MPHEFHITPKGAEKISQTGIPNPPLYVMWVAEGEFWIAEEHPFPGATKYIPEPQSEVLTAEQFKDRLTTLDAIANAEKDSEHTAQLVIRDLSLFETRVLKNIKASRGGYQSGDKRVHYIAAARRLEKLGYAEKPGTHWWITDKGEKFLSEIAEAK